MTVHKGLKRHGQSARGGTALEPAVHSARKAVMSHGQDADLLPVVTLLGGDRVFRGPVRSALDAHDLLRVGLPSQAITQLVSKLLFLDFASESMTGALGMSVRTYQRWKEAPGKTLSVEQSGRAWKFAEILARATEAFGGQAEAEQWLDQPATGLDQRRPIDLLATPAGVELVEDHLTRLEYGVYA